MIEPYAWNKKLGRSTDGGGSGMKFFNPFPADPELTRPGIVAFSCSPKSTLLSWPLQLMRNPNRVVYPGRNDSH